MLPGESSYQWDRPGRRSRETGFRRQRINAAPGSLTTEQQQKGHAKAKREKGKNHPRRENEASYRDSRHSQKDISRAIAGQHLVIVDKGTYGGRRIRFDDYAASVFRPHLFFGSIRAEMGCGSTALALLTGVPPEKAAAQNGSTHHSDEFMTRFLRRRGYRVLHLTLCNISATDSMIGKDNVILLSQLFRKNEATWGVIFNGSYYHNFDIYSLEVLSFLNKPILSAYLVIHPSWRLGRERRDRLRARPIPAKRSVPFSALRIKQSPRRTSN